MRLTRSSTGGISNNASIRRIRGLLFENSGYYPAVGEWFDTAVVPGLNDQTRRIFVASCCNSISGFVIAKKTPRERKLCTVWVKFTDRQQGIGTRLMIEAMNWLDTDFPLLTMPEDKLPEFRPLLSTLKFELTDMLPNYYRTGNTEIVFNGELRKTKNSPSKGAVCR